MAEDYTTTKDLGTLLQGVFKQKHWEERLGLHQVFLFWDALVGELAAHAQPEIIRDGTLWVCVADSVWMQQLQFEKQTLLEQINTELKRLHKKTNRATLPSNVPCLMDIKFKFQPNFGFKRSSPKKETQVQNPRVYKGSRFNDFEATIKYINDERIQNSLKSLWLATEQRKRK